MSSFLVLREGETRNRWRDGQVCPDVGHGIMAPWARLPGCVLIELRSELSDLSDDDNAANKAYESRILEGESSLEESGEETHEKDTCTFDAFKDFKLWKESIEKQASSLYVKNTGSKSGKTGGKIIYFYCHRNGFYNARDDMKRNMKIAGSNKINGNCPSKMKVYKDIESKGTVEFTKNHVGHGIDLGRVKITREEKEEIAEKL
ncbi:uncharacterized protein TNCV_2899701 [Trichonephila clavipes]|nr:uncharacterized protein TNCV_2899701 [Trichonephila clavipes]